jgi:predicted enzyme related to lactoylglutathione lyase
MIKITAFAYTAYPVTDLARARHFYEQLLGLKPATVVEFDGGHGWIEYEMGDGCVALANGFGDNWKPGAEGPAMVFEVADLTAATAELKAAGVKFKFEPMEFPPCHLAIAFDPDGNQIGLHQMKPRT